MEKVNAYLQITMKIKESDRPSAAKVYFDYREPFLNTIEGALTKALLVRDEDVQVLHGFDSKEHAAAYLQSDMFQNDVAKGLSPFSRQTLRFASSPWQAKVRVDERMAAVPAHSSFTFKGTTIPDIHSS